jgi:hypothetical protein
MATQAVPGPKRQLTATSLGDATGTVGVEVKVGGGVEEDGGVLDGTSVNVGWAAVSVGKIVAVGVGAVDGRLQASILKINKRLVKKSWCLIVLLIFRQLIRRHISYAKGLPTAIDPEYMNRALPYQLDRSSHHAIHEVFQLLDIF